MTANILDRPSPNHDPRAQGSRIDILVLHYTGMQTGAAALDRLCDPAAKVSSHYLVEEDGRIYRLVDEARRARHAGVSFWQGVSDVNSHSIGIEIVNPGHEWGYRPFPAAQMAAVRTLCQGILARHPIPPDRVVGHSDVAPARKEDPGELFDWPGLATAGIGLWPFAGPVLPAPAGFDAEAGLRRIGYGLGLVADLRQTVTAFQRRFRPAKVDGVLDSETRDRIAALAGR